jgi:TBC domain-containing protein kinase-like protein
MSSNETYKFNYIGLDGCLKKSTKQLGIQTFFSKIHPNDKCGINGLPLTPNSIRIYGRFQYLKTMKHANLCKYVDIERSSQQRLFVVIEHFTVKLTDLLDDPYLLNIIMANTGLIHKWLYEILLAVKYLHERNIVVRNLSLKDMLIDSSGQMKLTNYGLYHMTECGLCVDFHIGNCLYSAPEVYLQEFCMQKNEEKDLEKLSFTQLNNPKMDVWSIGVLLFVLIFNVNSGKYECFNKKHQDILVDMFDMVVMRTETNGYNYLLKLCEIDSETKMTVEKRWKSLVMIIRKCLEIDIHRRACLSNIISSFENELVTRIFTKDQIKHLFFDDKPDCDYDLINIFESQFNRLLHISRKESMKTSSVSDEPLLSRSIHEIYYLWRLIGADFMSILKSTTKDSLKLPAIKKPYLLCKVCVRFLTDSYSCVSAVSEEMFTFAWMSKVFRILVDKQK